MIHNMAPEQLYALLDVLPMELAFIDADDNVRFWNRTSERGPAWQPSVLGGSVLNCHKESSAAAVSGVVAKLKSGSRDVVDRCVMTERGVTRFRWFAVRDDEGKYLGALEMIQYGPEVVQADASVSDSHPERGRQNVRYSTSAE